MDHGCRLATVQGPAQRVNARIHTGEDKHIYLPTSSMATSSMELRDDSAVVCAGPAEEMSFADDSAVKVKVEELACRRLARRIALEQVGRPRE